MSKEQPGGSPLDVFDDEAQFAIPQNYASVGVKKILLKVPVKKPNKHVFVRVHPEPDYRRETLLLEHGEERELYLITTAAAKELNGLAQPYRLYTYITRQSALCLWPVRLEGVDGRPNDWWTSAHAAAAAAMKRWVRVEPDRGAGAYNVLIPENEECMSAPEWPELSLREILRLAFKDRVIETADHIVLRKLRGAA
jgi:hypothetical protein